MKSSVTLNVVIEDERWLENVDFDAVKVAEELKDLLFDYVEKVIGKGQHDILSVAKGLSLNVCLSDDDAVCKLNRDFRGIDKPTNVLSFKSNDKTINIILFPYIYSNKFRQKGSINICIDDEISSDKSHAPTNYVFISPCLDEQSDANEIFFDKCFQKDCEICSQSLEKLLKYN